MNYSVHGTAYWGQTPHSDLMQNLIRVEIDKLIRLLGEKVFIALVNLGKDCRSLFNLISI
jgi:hypothetical protein